MYKFLFVTLILLSASINATETQTADAGTAETKVDLTAVASQSPNGKSLYLIICSAIVIHLLQLVFFLG